MTQRRKRTSWGERRKLGGGGGNRLKDWKDDGSIVVAIQTKSGITPRLFHLIPYVGEDEETKKKVIKFFPFVCHEDPVAYANRVPAQNCPIDRAIELIADDGRIDDDDVVWEASIGKSQKDRIITKADFCNFKGADWKGSFKPRQQYVFVAVEIEHPEEGLRVAVEPVTLGDALIDCVNNEIDGNGDEIGDPELNPYAFKFSYDKSAKQPKDYYSAFAYRRAEITDEIRELLDSEPVDISNWIDPGNSADLRKIFEAHFKVDPSIVDLDMIFDAVLDPDNTETQKKRGSGDDAASDDESDESDEGDEGDDNDNEDDGNGDECETCGGTGTIGKKKTKCPDCGGTGRVEQEEEQEEEQEQEEDNEPDQVVCETCDGNGTIGKKKIKCPDCGGTGLVTQEEEAEEEPEPEPPKKSGGKKGGGKKSDGKKSGGKKGGGKKKEEPPPDPNSNTKCGGCQRMIPDDVNVCPYCGAEFGDDDD